eukprot:Colp12_sorted_trinity150504_noHs@12298
MQQLRHWQHFYPQGYPATAEQKHLWMAPAARMFAQLKHPQLFDKALRQTLVTCCRALTPKPVSSTSGGSSNGKVGNGSAMANGASTSTTKSNTTTAAFNHTTNQPSHAVQHNQHAPSGSYSTSAHSSAHSTYENVPLLTSKQELSLFLRWLNNVYDGVNKAGGDNNASASDNTNPTSTTNTATTTSSTPSNNSAALVPTIDPPLNIRQGMLKHISAHLQDALSHRSAEFIIECVRITEYALLCRAGSVGEYMNLTTLTQRIGSEVSMHPDWNIQTDSTATATTTTNGNTTTNSTSTTNSNNSEWRHEITEAIRQDMIYRVEKMLRLVSMQLGINTVEDLNCKIQQYEMGLVVSASSLEEYVDKGTMPKRLAQLVTDFADYKKTLSPDQMVV